MVVVRAVCYSLTESVYPTRADSKGVSVRAIGHGTVVKLLNAWQMGSIYQDFKTRNLVL
jgi:hypothetical protein